MSSKKILLIPSVLLLLSIANMSSLAADNCKRVNILDSFNVYDIYTAPLYLNMNEKSIIVAVNTDNTFDVMSLGEWFRKNELYTLSSYKNSDDITVTVWNQNKTTAFSRTQLESWYSSIEIGDIVQVYPLDSTDQLFLYDVEEVTALNEDGDFITQRTLIENPDFFN